MKLVPIPAGEFQMGSPESEEGRSSREHQHRVRITQPFYLGQHEVTLGQFREFVTSTGYKTDAEKDGKGGYGYDKADEKNPFSQKPEYTWRSWGFEQADNHPVVNVSWNDAVAFCQWLSKKEGKTYRLPTEAEWEYACRAGTTTRYHNGDDPEGLTQIGNVGDATLKQKINFADMLQSSDGHAITAPVGSFKPNAFGLYDMHGNADEWCSDWYDGNYYKNSPADNPKGPDAGSSRVFRGGGWRSSAVDCRSAFRYTSVPTYRSANVGFRVLRER